MNERAQISIEYLIIIGVAIGVLVPGILFFYTYSKSDEGSTTSSRINDIGLRMISTVKSTYALGNGAWQSVEFIMPGAVTHVYVNPLSDTELVFVYETPYGPSEAVFYSQISMVPANADGNISVPHPGLTRYRLTSQGTKILINETT